MGEKEPLYTADGGCKLATLEAPQQAKKNRIITCPLDTARSVLGTYKKEFRSMYYRDPCTSMFIAVLFTIVKLWKWPWYPSVGEQ